MKTKLVGAVYDQDRASEAAFHSATARAFRDALQDARPALMEPVMDLEVIVPQESTGDVIGDLNARRGEIHGMKPMAGGMQAIRGHVALSEMFGYATDLRSITQGRGSFTMEFDYYAPVPEAVSQRILGGPLYAS
jgi:elongation factor G